jgi:hypothetical protein
MAQDGRFRGFGEAAAKQAAEKVEIRLVSGVSVPQGHLNRLRKMAESRSGRWEKPQGLKPKPLFAAIALVLKYRPDAFSR